MDLLSSRWVRDLVLLVLAIAIVGIVFWLRLLQHRVRQLEADHARRSVARLEPTLRQFSTVRATDSTIREPAEWMSVPAPAPPSPRAAPEEPVLPPHHSLPFDLIAGDEPGSTSASASEAPQGSGQSAASPFEKQDEGLREGETVEECRTAPPVEPTPFSRELVLTLFRRWCQDRQRPELPPTVEVSPIQHVRAETGSDGLVRRHVLRDAPQLVQFVRFSAPAAAEALLLPDPNARYSSTMSYLFPAFSRENYTPDDISRAEPVPVRRRDDGDWESV